MWKAHDLLDMNTPDMAAQGQKSPIQVREATRADIDDVVRINVDAFSPGIMNRLMYPTGMSDDARSKLASTMVKIVEDAETGAGDSSKPKASESFLLVAETGSAGEGDARPEVVAFARWDVWRELRSEQQWNVVEPVSEYTAEGANDEIMEAFLGGIRGMRRRNMRGDPGICKYLMLALSTWGMRRVANAEH